MIKLENNDYDTSVTTVIDLHKVTTCSMIILPLFISLSPLNGFILDSQKYCVFFLFQNQIYIISAFKQANTNIPILNFEVFV